MKQKQYKKSDMTKIELPGDTILQDHITAVQMAVRWKAALS